MWKIIDESMPYIRLFVNIQERIKAKLTELLPLLAVIFCVVQPVLDVMGYWQVELGISNGEIARLMGCSRSTIGRRLSVLPKNLQDDTAVHDAP